MALLTEETKKNMIANFNANQKARYTPDDGEHEIDFKPVVKLFSPYTGFTWLLTEYDPDTECAFGLCDLGMGFPELGDVSITELENSQRSGIALIEVDTFFEADKTLSQYAKAARINGSIEA